MHFANINFRSHSGCPAPIKCSVMRSWFLTCCLALPASAASPETAPRVPAPRELPPPSAAGIPEKEPLEQRAIALVKTAKWRIPEEADIQHAVHNDDWIVGTTKSGTVEAFDAATGQKKWEKASGGTTVSELEIDGDIVLIRVTDSPPALTALALADGSQKWALDLPGSRLRMDGNGPHVAVGVNLSEYRSPRFGPMRMPTTRETPPGPPELRIFARDTGKLLWTHPLPEGTTEYGGYELESAGDLLYLFTYRRIEGAGVTALNPADGKTRWTHPIPVGTESATLMLADGLVVMNLATDVDADPPKKGHQQFIVLNAADGTLARILEVDETLGWNRPLPHGLMLMTRPPLLKSFRTFDFQSTRTLTPDDVKAKFTLWDLKTGALKWNTAVFLDEKKYHTTSMNIRQDLYIDENVMLVSLDGTTTQAGPAAQKNAWCLASLDLTTGNTLWSNTVENTHTTFLNHVLFYKQLIIVNSEEGVLALNRADGRGLWYIPSPGSIWLTANGTLYLQIHEPTAGIPTGLYAIPLERNPAANPTTARRP
jgi:outer membrane protein assembly factor BamB